MKVWLLKDTLPNRGFFLSFKKPLYRKKDIRGFMPEAEVPDHFITADGDSSYADRMESYNIRIRHAPKDFHSGECRPYELIGYEDLEALREKISRLEAENLMLRASNKPDVF